MDKKIFLQEEIKEKIAQETANFEVPDSLTPGKIEERLKSVHQSGGKRPFYRHKRMIAACAALFVLLTAGIPFSVHQYRQSKRNINDPVPLNPAVADSGEHNYSSYATNYEDISGLINQYYKKVSESDISSNGETYSITNDMAGSYEEGEQFSGADSDDISGSVARSDSSVQKSSSSSEDYSRTDTQVEGVMEGDVVKTDGSHIFALNDNVYGSHISIYDVDGKKVKKQNDLTLPNCSCREMYLEGTTLILICDDWVQSENSAFAESDIETAEEKTFMHSYAATGIYLYDVSDSTAPKEISHHSQSGSFQTSRLTGDYLYTYTSYSAGLNTYDSKEPEQFIPLIDGEPIAANRILMMQKKYFPSYMVMSSLKLGDSRNFVDCRAVWGGSDTYYMSNDNLYMVQRSNEYTLFDPVGSAKSTIVKYSYNDGIFSFVADARIRGEILDSYCMHEYNGYFVFVYTTTKNGRQSNGLCTMDNKLTGVGELTGLGKNETIYSSYFIDYMAYFVTYRNTDPVFAVDITNPEKPVLKSELKLPGFSSYLHSFGKDTLLGIGEGENNNLKFSLFSISPEKVVSEVFKKELSEGTVSIAGSNHRAVFVDEERGLFGLCVDHYYDDSSSTYEVYQYKNDKLKQVLSTSIEASYYTRGVRIGEYFYIVDVESGVKVFNINTWK